MQRKLVFKRYLILFVVILFQFSVKAAFYRNQPTTVFQPDGEKINCFASGDEFFNYLHDADNFTIIRASDGYFCYGIEKDGWVVASQYRVNKVNPVSVGLKNAARISVENYKAKAAKYKDPNNNITSKAPLSGKLNNIVVYIRFSDQAEFTINRQIYDNKFNPTTGVSLRSYYKQVSYNMLDIESHHFPVAALTTNLSYQDPNPRDYYSPYDASYNPIGYQGDSQRTQREHILLKNAISFISSQVPAELNVDGDNDGNVDNVCFLIRGNSDNWADLLWGHRWYLFSQNAYINGKRVYDYTFQNENQNDVQTLCHEMFHALGAPDLYHYSYDGFTTAGPWDIMESGFGHMGAYMKYKYSNGTWIPEIPLIISSGTYTINSLDSSSNNCYMIASPYTEDEYFVVEFRKKAGTFEGTLPGSGLLVYRINPNAGDGNADGPPDEVYIYRPNGSISNNGNINNAYFSLNSGRTAINDSSNPSSFLTAGGFGGLDIKQVGTSSGNTISFYVTINNSPIPVPNFRTDAAYINQGEAINFSDMSMRNPSRWNWTFEGGTPSTSTSQNPTNIRYQLPGVWNVTLTVSNANGSITKMKPAYITVDGPENWQPQNTHNYNEQRRVNRLFALNQLVAWASYSDVGSLSNGVMDFSITGDGGYNWTSNSIAGYDGYKIQSISGSGTSRGWVAIWDSINGEGKILRTTDGGNTWMHQSSASFAYPNGKPEIIHTYSLSKSFCIGNPNDGYFEIYTTTNSGASWIRVQQANIPPSLADEVVVNNCYDVFGNHIWFGTNKGRVFHSSDAGLNWNVINTSLTSIDRIVIKDVSNIVIQKLNNGFEMKRSSDGGATWNDYEVSGSFFPSKIEYANGENLWLNVSEDPANCGSSYSIDDGYTWVAIDTNIRYSTISFVNPYAGWAGSFNHDSYFGGVFSWNNIVTNIFDEVFSQEDLMLYPNPALNEVYVSSKDFLEKEINMTIINSEGKILEKHQILLSRTAKIDTKNLANGVYFVHLQNNKINQTRKLIIAR